MVKAMFRDLLFLCVFLVIGFGLRETIKPFKKIYLPASVIGGTLLLIIGQQGFNLVTIPGSFSKFAGVLIDRQLFFILIFIETFS